jgi:hypothetical protein
MGRLAAVLLVLLVAGAARAEMVRCEDADGRLRFTDDPRHCASAEADPPEPGRVQRIPAPPGPKARAGAPEPTAADEASLSHLLPAAPSGWEVDHEAVDVERDPRMRAQGLLESVASHYGRIEGPVSLLCTVEIWSFASPARARVAQASFETANEWTRTVGVVGSLLVLARSVRMERGVGASRDLAGDCLALAVSVDGTPRR